MTTQIEDEPLTWYLFNTVIDLGIGDIIQYKNIMKQKVKYSRDLWQNRLSK